MIRANVIIDSLAKPVDRGFSYRVPEALCKEVVVGVRVRVPFGAGNRQEIGYIIKVEKTEENAELKDILEVLDKKPLFDRNILLEAYHIKNRYFAPFSAAIKLFLPPGSAKTLTEWVRLLDNTGTETALEKRVADILSQSDGICAFDVLKEQIGEKTRAIINKMAEKGILEISHTASEKVSMQHIKVVRLIAEPKKKLSDAALRAVHIMRECTYLSISDLCLFASCSSATVRTLIKNGILETESMEVLRKPGHLIDTENNEKKTLNSDQQNVVNQILESLTKPFRPMLLRGVTGSGKTEVYLEAIASVVDRGGSAIVLVPEIALTHQMVSRFISRFGDLTAVLHSGLSVGQRHDEWIRIARGDARVVVGARSAVFAPCQNLKLIVIDEEHEDTYKSETGVRYHARDVAFCRANTEGAQVLLASATPSVVSYYYAKNGIYQLFEMETRYNEAALPKAYIVDMREELKNGNRSPISHMLRSEIEKNLKNKEQSILFLNRRGYATFVSCRSCGEVVNCPHCSISLTYHSFSETLNCHYCGYRQKMLSVCPVCGSKHIRSFGTGTQKIEENIETIFPDTSLIRMDVDTTGRKDAHEKLLRRFRDENVPILLGTQMIAKGLDFPNVTLVGVLNADQILNLSDYRACERTFDLVTQVCGRAGRGEKEGRCIIQTYAPESTVIQYAARQDYLSFYDEEINLRKALNYPPFCDIINIIVTGHEEKGVKEAAMRLQKCVRDAVPDSANVFKAAPCGVHKIKNAYRWHFWLKCKIGKELCACIQKAVDTETKFSVIVDVNPVSM